METTTKQVEATSQGVDNELEISPYAESPVNSSSEAKDKMAVEDQKADTKPDTASNIPIDENDRSNKTELKSSEGEESDKHQNAESTSKQIPDKDENVDNSNSLSEVDHSVQTDGKNDDTVNASEDKSVQTSTESSSGKKMKKKQSKSEEKKLVDLLVHVFDGLDTPEKKMEALAKKYIQLAADMKTTETKLEDIEIKHREAKREKEQIQADYGKVNMAKTKLESLCRELQKQNKIIKEEIQRRADEEDRKRRELSQKFQTTINDITTQMGENHKRNQQLKQDNTDLAQKLKGLVEQYEVREQHIEKVLKAKQLELQLCEAKLQQQTLTSQEERQNNLKEKHVLLQESLDQKKKVEMLVKQEAELKSQLALYTEKFVEFQSTLTKSNEVFATFKKEMDKMTKTIRKLEKESNMWKTRYENTNISLLQMVEERTQKDEEIALQKGKVDKLEKLCRALQSERRKLKKELEEFQKDKNVTDQARSESSASPEQSTNNEKEEGTTSCPSSVPIENGLHEKDDSREGQKTDADKQPCTDEQYNSDQKLCSENQRPSNDEADEDCNGAGASTQVTVMDSVASSQLNDEKTEKMLDQTAKCSNDDQ